MPPRQFRVGDRVILGTHHPQFGGWTTQLSRETGSITRQDSFVNWRVDFPSHRGFHAIDSDLILADEQPEDMEEGIFRCAYCQAKVPEDEIRYDSDEVGICESCQEKVAQCENCGRWSDELCVCANYCPPCHREYCHSTLIHDYHASHYRHRRFLPDDKQDLYLGIELEMETEDDIDEVALALQPLSRDESIFLMEEDSSLCDGLEIVSEPATLSYHKTEFGWQKILATACDARATSHENGDCGLHIHFNVSFFDHSDEAIDLNSAKLLYFFERFWESLFKFSRRTESQLNSTAARYGSPRGTTPKEICDTAKSHGRYYAINLENANTVEIRIFRGTLVEETFFACLELVDFLARYVKKHTIHYIQRVTWDKVVKAIKTKDYPNLISYLKKKELLNVRYYS